MNRLDFIKTCGAIAIGAVLPKTLISEDHKIPFDLPENCKFIEIPDNLIFNIKEEKLTLVYKDIDNIYKSHNRFANHGLNIKYKTEDNKDLYRWNSPLIQNVSQQELDHFMNYQIVDSKHYTLLYNYKLNLTQCLGHKFIGFTPEVTLESYRNNGR